MPKGFSEYMPEEVETRFIQARVPMALADTVGGALKDRGLSWAWFFRAACEKFLDETGAACRKNKGQKRKSKPKS